MSSGSATHLDLFLELTRGGPLATWRLPEGLARRFTTPVADSSNAGVWAPVTPADGFGRFPALRLAPHRPVYLGYRGPIPGRGWIEPLARGTARVFHADPDSLRAALAPLPPPPSGRVVRAGLLLELTRNEGNESGPGSPSRVCFPDRALESQAWTGIIRSLPPGG